MEEKYSQKVELKYEHIKYKEELENAKNIQTKYKLKWDSNVEKFKRCENKHKELSTKLNDNKYYLSHYNVFFLRPLFFLMIL